MERANGKSLGFSEEETIKAVKTVKRTLLVYNILAVTPCMNLNRSRKFNFSLRLLSLNQGRLESITRVN